MERARGPGGEVNPRARLGTAPHLGPLSGRQRPEHEGPHGGNGVREKPLRPSSAVTPCRPPDPRDWHTATSP